MISKRDFFKRVIRFVMSCGAFWSIPFLGYLGIGGLASSPAIDRQINAALKHLPPRKLTYTIVTRGGPKPQNPPGASCITAEEISRSKLKPAILAIEDRRFEDRAMFFDLLALARASVSTAMGKKQGGSTIYLQTAKLIQGKLKSTWGEKPLQFLIAYRLMMRFENPDDILALYANLAGGQEPKKPKADDYGIPFLENRGLEYLSLSLYGVRIEELDWAQAAQIAAWLKSPEKFDPRGKHPQQAEERRKLVLQELKTQGRITEAEYQSALAPPAMSSPTPSVKAFTHFTEALQIAHHR